MISLSLFETNNVNTPNAALHVAKPALTEGKEPDTATTRETNDHADIAQRASLTCKRIVMHSPLHILSFPHNDQTAFLPDHIFQEHPLECQTIIHGLLRHSR